MKNTQYTNALGDIAWGYLLLHLNINLNTNLGTLNILPNWLGLIFILQALPAIAERERTAKLLAPFAVFLIFAEFLAWFFTLVGRQVEFPLVTLVLTCISLYFHFQLLTNLANIAVQDGLDGQAKSLRTLRSWRTVVLTLLVLLMQLGQLIPTQDTMRSIHILLTLVMAALGIILCCTLFSYRKASVRISHIQTQN